MKNFLLNEEGTIAEYLIRVTIVSLGSTAILFGILAALRLQGGNVINAINSFSF